MTLESEQTFGPNERPSTAGLFGKLMQEALHLRSPRLTNERIKWLLEKTHTVGKVTINIPNLVAFQLIQQLDQTDRAKWALECLYILAHQHNEEALFLRGHERQIAIAQYARNILATDLPKYMIAILDTIEAVQKKSESYSEHLMKKANQVKTEISHLASSPSPNPQDTNSPTSPEN